MYTIDNQSAKQKCKANSHPCILESILLYTIIHFLDGAFKVKNPHQNTDPCFQRLL